MLKSNNLKYDINKDWLDFYYLTKPEKYIIMCSQFSSYSLCASILGNKKIVAPTTNFLHLGGTQDQNGKRDCQIVDK